MNRAGFSRPDDVFLTQEKQNGQSNALHRRRAAVCIIVEGKRFCKDIIRRHKRGEKIEGPDGAAVHQFFLAHPGCLKKIAGRTISHYIVGRGPPFFRNDCFYVVFTDGTKDDFSYELVLKTAAHRAESRQTICRCRGSSLNVGACNAPAPCIARWGPRFAIPRPTWITGWNGIGFGPMPIKSTSQPGDRNSESGVQYQLRRGFSASARARRAMGAECH